MKSKLYFLLVLLSVSFGMKAQTYTSVSTFAGTSNAGLVNGSLATAQFYGPYGICMDDATGTMYVADALNNCIRKISNGNVSTLAGNSTAGDLDGQGTNARLHGPCGICFSNGYVYITDNANNKIKRIDTLGNVVTIAGTGTAGHLDGAALQAKFNNPVNLTADINGNILVADYGNNCIRHIINGQVVTYAGVPGAGGDQLGSAATAKFNRPTGLAMDGAGNLFVADQVNGKIKMISGGIVTLVAGSGANSSIDGSGASASFYRPTYIDFDLYGNLIVVEWITSKIRRVTPGGVVTSIAGTGISGYTNGAVSVATFNTPYGICVDNIGNAYIGDKMNNVIRKISIDDVGFAENQNSFTNLNLYPNPSSGDFTILNSTDNTIREIRVYDVQGNLCKIMHVEDKQENIVISLAELKAGEYVIVTEADKANGKATVIKK